MNDVANKKDQPASASVPEEKRAAEYLANERTFLAWIRTSIGVLTLGFVVAKFSLWLGSLGRREAALDIPRSGISFPIGLAMMGFGAIVAVLALWRYHVVNEAIDSGKVKADKWLVILITVSMVTIAAVMIGGMLITMHAP